MIAARLRRGSMVSVTCNLALGLLQDSKPVQIDKAAEAAQYPALSNKSLNFKATTSNRLHWPCFPSVKATVVPSLDIRQYWNHTIDCFILDRVMSLSATSTLAVRTNQPDWRNLSVIHTNTLPPRASFYLYDKEEDALTYDSAKSRTHSLNGQWDFHLAGTSQKGKIQVPGMWQLQGYGKGPHYTNTMFPFPVDPPNIMENEIGVYSLQFVVPTAFKDDQLRLRFEGVDAAYHVDLNGHRIGYSQGSRNPAEFDVTKQLSFERENHLVVQVYQRCDGSYIEDQVCLEFLFEISGTSFKTYTILRTNGGCLESSATSISYLFHRCISKISKSRLS